MLSAAGWRRVRRSPAWLSWHGVAMALVSAGVIHIASTYAIPVVGSGAGVARLEELAPANRMVVLPASAPGRQPSTFTDPSDRLAICRLDLRQGPVQLSAVLADRGWTLSIHSREGDSFYALAGSTLRQPAVTLMIEPPRDRLLGIIVLPHPPPIDPNRVIAPELDGIAVIRAPSRGGAFAAETEKALAEARCVPQGAAD